MDVGEFAGRWVRVGWWRRGRGRPEMGMARFCVFDQLYKALHQVRPIPDAFLVETNPAFVSLPPPPSIAKWLPQLLLNYTRQSTHGFSIYVTLLDIIGSLASLAELVLASLLAHDPRGIIGNPVKLGLSLMTVGFDGVFVVQRYVLYGADEGTDPDGGTPTVEGGREPDEESPLLA